jgi:hypothetical protein
VSHVSGLAPLLSAAGVFVAVFVYAGLFEYAYHRWVLHRPSRMLPYPFQVHVLLHHRVFQGDMRYHVHDENDRNLILFQWWQVSLLLAGHAVVTWPVQMASGLPVFWSGMAALVAYYAVYEYLHWCMHNPAQRVVERTRMFRYLDTRHRLHHTEWRVNFNVVLPIGDLLFRTLCRPGPAAARYRR